MSLFFGSFRKADADDPDTFTAGCLRLFTAYEPQVVQYVVDPLTGLPGKSEWLPALRKVKEALDERAGWVARVRERDKLEREQIEERQRETKSRDRRPTLDELKARHGENWGFKATDRWAAEVKARREELQRKANKVTFERECEKAGMPKDSPISPSLASLIKAGMA